MSRGGAYVPIDRSSPPIRTYVELRRYRHSLRRERERYNTPTARRYLASLRELVGVRS